MPVPAIVKIVLLFLIVTLPYQLTQAQVSNPYFLNGMASQDNCNCYTLTQDGFNLSGAVWNIYKIDLNEPFDFKFSVFLGSNDQQGADGIVFVLQPISTNIGSVGGGLGFSGVTPSIGVTIDTWQNANNEDPVYDHISIQKNGDLNHSGTNNLAGPVTALQGKDNIEDGQWHLLRIEWNPASKVMRTSMDGVERLSASVDLIKNVFNGDPMVYWGFTASTGGAKNLQRFCTALNPGIKSLNNIETCYGKPIQFADSSSSFGKIVKWFWDLGDGTKDTTQSPPSHLYAAPGIYDVKLNILGNNGCLSDTFRLKVTVGSDPFAAISFSPSEPCEAAPIQLLDVSAVTYGTVNNWNWTVGGLSFQTQNPTITQGLPAGSQNVSLSVKTKEGCISSPVTMNIAVKAVPKVNFSNSLVCAGEEITLSGVNQTPLLSIDKWKWDFGNGNIDSSGQSVQYTYPGGGSFNTSLQAIASNGCASPVVQKPVEVFQTNAFAGNDTIVALDQPFELKGSGGIIYNWSPPFGLSDPSISNPLATLQQDATYFLTVSTPAGCESKDTINIRVFKGPEIYVPTAFTPNGDGLNDVVTALPVGVTFQYLKIFDRWGKLVFETTDHRKGWDGKTGSIVGSTGTYVWVTRGVEGSGKIYQKKGTLTLIR
jgi:gliding motility-associated-like protein